MASRQISEVAIEQQAHGLPQRFAGALRRREWTDAINIACFEVAGMQRRTMTAIFQLARQAPPRNDLALALLQQISTISVQVSSELQGELLRTLAACLDPVTQHEADRIHLVMFNCIPHVRTMLECHLIPSREAIEKTDASMLQAIGPVADEYAKVRAAFLAIHDARVLQEAMALERPARETAPHPVMGGM